MRQEQITFIVLLLLIANLACAGGFTSQKYGGLNYVSNLNKEPFGCCSYLIRPYNFGYYVEYKTDCQRPNEDVLYHNISIWEAEEEFDCEFMDKKTSYRSYNSGFTFPISDNLAIYCGVGCTEITGYLQYYHPAEVFGKNGKFWIEDPHSTDYELNWFVGSLFRLGNLIFQLGIDTQPRSVVLGGGLAF